jgi:uncharacterized membrane protein
MTKEYANAGDTVELYNGKVVTVVVALDRSIVYKENGRSLNARHGNYTIKAAA